MTLARILVGFTGFAFALYGVACLISPELPAGYAGIELPGASGATEVVAMYGGLQTGLGVFLLICVARPANLHMGLVVLVALVGSLAIGRGFGLLVHGPTAYNVGAICYELSSAGLGLVALRMLRTQTA